MPDPEYEPFGDDGTEKTEENGTFERRRRNSYDDDADAAAAGRYSPVYATGKKVTHMVNAHEGVLQVHGFYVDTEKKSMTCLGTLPK